MSHRTQASVLALVLFVVLGVVLILNPVPYVVVSPGPTVNILGDVDGKPIVQIDGHRTYPTKGQLRLVTVSVTTAEKKVGLFEALRAWVGKDQAVLPYKAMYPETVSDEQDRAESAAQMVNSQDTAVAAALSQLGYKLPTYAEVTGVSPGGPSDGVLKPRDRFVSIGGTKIDDLKGVFDAVGSVKPGDKLSGVVLRNGKEKDFTVTTGKAPDDPKRAVLGVLIGTGYQFPFDVQVALGDNIGGPSAGLMFALSIYDTLTPGPLTGGKVIAGTGTIASDGTVGPIGGIRQKIVGAKEAGATLFFVPKDNCDSAVEAPVDPSEIRLVRADTMSSALDSLRKYRANPDADLPRCPTP